MKYGIQAGGLTAAIHIGRLNKKQDAFLDKEDHTDMAIGAVAQYVDRHYDGRMTAVLPGVNKQVTVTVTDLIEENES